MVALLDGRVFFVESPRLGAEQYRHTLVGVAEEEQLGFVLELLKAS